MVELLIFYGFWILVIFLSAVAEIDANNGVKAYTILVVLFLINIVTGGVSFFLLEWPYSLYVLLGLLIITIPENNVISWIAVKFVINRRNSKKKSQEQQKPPVVW